MNSWKRMILGWAVALSPQVMFIIVILYHDVMPLSPGIIAIIGATLLLFSMEGFFAPLCRISAYIMHVIIFMEIWNISWEGDAISPSQLVGHAHALGT